MDAIRQLFEAAEHGNQPVVEELIDLRGVHPDVVDEDFCTPLQYAACNGHEQIVGALLSRRANADHQSQYGFTALMQASSYGHIPVVSMLLAQGADVNLTNAMGATALVCAARGGHTSVVHSLFSAGASVNATQGGVSALMVAAQNGHESVVRLLIDQGANVRARMEDTGWTSLMFAALNGHLQVVQVLVHHKADANAVNIMDQTALVIASTQNHSAVELFLEKRTHDGHRVTPHKERRQTIFEAAKNGEYDVLKRMIEDEKKDVNQKDQDGATCLMFAAMRGHQNVAELLVENGADVNEQDSISGWTALMQATYYGHQPIASLLIDHDANVGIQAKNGCTAFDIASIIGDTEVVRLLARVSMRAPAHRYRVLDVTDRASSAGRRQPSPHSPGRRSFAFQMDDRTLRPASGNSISEETMKPSGRISRASLQVPHIHNRLPQSPKPSSWWKKVANRFGNIKKGLLSSMTKRSKEEHDRNDVRTTPSVRMHQTIGGTARSPQRAKLESPPWRSGGGLIGSQSIRQRSLNMGAPISKLPADILAPIKPPFMPPPAFELSHIERPKLQRPSHPEFSRPSIAESASAPHIQGIVKRGSASFLRPHSGSRVGAWTATSSASANSIANKKRSSGAEVDPNDIETTENSKLPLASKPSATSVSLRRRLRKRTSRVLPATSEDRYGSSSEEQVDDLASVLRQNRLGIHITHFMDQEIDLESFLTLTDDDLIELGFHDKGVRNSLLSVIDKLSNTKAGHQESVQEAVSKFRRKRGSDKDNEMPALSPIVKHRAPVTPRTRSPRSPKSPIRELPDSPRLQSRPPIPKALPPNLSPRSAAKLAHASKGHEDQDTDPSGYHSNSSPTETPEPQRRGSLSLKPPNPLTNSVLRGGGQVTVVRVHSASPNSPRRQIIRDRLVV